MRNGGRRGEGKCYSKYGSTALSLSPCFFFSLHLTLDFVQMSNQRSLFSLVICGKLHNELETNQTVFALYSSSFYYLCDSASCQVSQCCIVSLSCVFPVECHLTKASPPAITLDYPPVTAELMFSSHHSGSKTVTQRGISLQLHLHRNDSQSGPERKLMTEACTSNHNRRRGTRRFMC